MWLCAWAAPQALRLGGSSGFTPGRLLRQGLYTLGVVEARGGSAETSTSKLLSCGADLHTALYANPLHRGAADLHSTLYVNPLRRGAADLQSLANLVGARQVFL